MRPRRPVFSTPSLAPCPLCTNLFCPLPTLCFQSLTTVKFSKPFVLITIRNAGGLVGASLKTFKHFNAPMFKHSLRISFTNNACEPFATVDSKRLTQALSSLESALTSHPQLIENTATLSPLEATLTRFFAVIPLYATLTKNWGRVGPCRSEN